MVATHSYCCAFCEKQIPIEDVFLSSLRTAVIWSVRCPACETRNYMPALQNSLLLALAILFAGITGASLASDASSLFVAFLSLPAFFIYRGLLNCIHLRFGRLRTTMV